MWTYHDERKKSRKHKNFPQFSAYVDKWEWKICRVESGWGEERERRKEIEKSQTKLLRCVVVICGWMEWVTSRLFVYFHHKTQNFTHLAMLELVSSLNSLSSSSFLAYFFLLWLRCYHFLWYFRYDQKSSKGFFFSHDNVLFFCYLVIQSNLIMKGVAQPFRLCFNTSAHFSHIPFISCLHRDALTLASDVFSSWN